VELNDAIKQAYEFAPADEIYYDTLQLDNDCFTEPIKVVNSYEELVTNQGTFLPVRFDFKLPEVGSGIRGQMTITVMGVPLSARNIIRVAASQTYVTTVTYRQYLKGDMDPSAYFPVPLSVQKITENYAGIEFTAVVPDLTALYFPRRLMDTTNLPGARF